jgi:hypothetical protein
VTTPTFADDSGSQRWYILPTGERLMSVTTVLSYVAKHFLVDWAAGLAADAALERGQDVADAQDTEPCNAYGDDACGRCRSCLRAWIAGRHTAIRDDAGDRGSRFHEAVEHMTLFDEGGSVDADVRPYFDAYREWIDRVQPEVLSSEATVFSRRWGYAGTLDAIMQIPADADLPKPMRHLRGKRLVVDYKSGKSVDRLAAWQMAAYRHAEAELMPDGTEVPVPKVDGGLVLHIRPEGVQMREAFVGSKTFNQFVYALRVAEGMTSPLGESLSRPASFTKKGATV